MPWDKDGFCTICQLQLKECRCPGADRERRRRRRETDARSDDEPRQVRNGPSDMGPHPADRVPETSPAEAAQFLAARLSVARPHREGA